MIGGVLAGALTLIAVQVFTSSNGAQRGGALLQWVSGGVQQLISPDKAAIPNLAAPKSTTTPPPSGSQQQPGHGSVGGQPVPVSLPVNPVFERI